MALGTINELVKERLPYLTADNDSTIASFLTEAFYFFQTDFEKLDADVEDETKYTNLQRSFLADYVAYLLISKKSIETSGGTGGAAGTGTLLKRAKADVTEAEFMQVKASDGTLIMMSTKDLMHQLKVQLCSKAAKLNISLWLCDIESHGSVIAPLIYVPTI